MILCTYFGITRYLILRFHSSDNYIENYHKLPKSDSKKVVVVIHSTPDKINTIRPMINSILDQTIRVDRIFLTVSTKNNYKLSEYLEKVVTLLPMGKNYGEGFVNSLVPILMHEKDCNTAIVALADNIIYGKDFLETILNLSEKTPKTVIIDKGKKSILIKPEYYDCNILNRDNDKYTEDWFLTKCPYKSINYNENYKY